MKINNHTLKIVCILLIVLGVGFVFFSAFEMNKSAETPVVKPVVAKKKVSLPKLFGIQVDSFTVEKKVIQHNEFLSNILGSYQIDPLRIAKLVQKSKPVFNVRKMAAGKPYTLFTYKEDPTKVAYLIYEDTPIDYVVYDLRDTLQVYTGKKDVVTKTESVAGEISSSLYDALQEQGADPVLAIKLAEIYGWAVDFYAIGKGDWFKIQYERQYVDHKPIGAGQIKAAILSHKGKELQAYYFQPDHAEKGFYYDENGNSMKRTFLKAPLKFSRITSRYTKRRLHPVQKIWKAHLGTDYAAPRGTPIIATGSGVVIASSYTSGNGNYVKIKHNNTYTTQYLHMSRRAVRNGQRVEQGQVIGYVGSTGLATGPHVCYRFWKNGRQVDPLRQNFHEAIPLDKKYLAAFKASITSKQEQFAALAVKDHHTLTASNQSIEATDDEETGAL